MNGLVPVYDREDKIGGGSSQTNRPTNDVLLIHSCHVETVVMLSHKKPDSHINVKVEFGEGEGKVPLKAISERAEAYKPKE